MDTDRIKELLQESTDHSPPAWLHQSIERRLEERRDATVFQNIWRWFWHGPGIVLRPGHAFMFALVFSGLILSSAIFVTSSSKEFPNIIDTGNAMSCYFIGRGLLAGGFFGGRGFFGSFLFIRFGTRLFLGSGFE